MDGLDVIIILNKLDGCPSNRIDWILDGLLTILISYKRYRRTRHLVHAFQLGGSFSIRLVALGLVAP